MAKCSISNPNIDLCTGQIRILNPGKRIYLQLSNALIKFLRIFRIVGHPRDPKGEDHGYLTTFRGINAPKSGPFKYENNAQTLPKQLQNNLEKVKKSTFLTPKMVKTRVSIWPKVSIFGSIFDQ